MALAATRVTVTTSATLLFSADADGSRVRIRVPAAGQTVFIGGTSGVTTATGFEVLTGTQTDEFVLGAGDTLYGIVAATTQATHVLAVG